MNKKAHFIKKIGNIITLPSILVVIVLQLVWDKIPSGMSSIQYMMLIVAAVFILFVIAWLSLKFASVHFDDSLTDIQQSMETKDIKIHELHEAMTSHLQKAEGIIKISQRLTFIDDEILGVFEKEASEIWILTTTLEKDIGPLKESVFQNLRSGKNYTYFTPHKSFPGIENVEQNKIEYKKVYEETFKDMSEEEKGGIGKFRFLEFPRETILFTTEVVIHNPMDIHRRRGFTYVETKGSKITGEELVEISAGLTTYIVNILRPIIDKEETISKELFEFMWNLKLEKEDYLRLMSIAKRDTLIKKKEIDEIVNSIDGLTPHSKLVLESILERFVVYGD